MLRLAVRIEGSGSAQSAMCVPLCTEVEEATSEMDEKRRGSRAVRSCQNLQSRPLLCVSDGGTHPLSYTLPPLVRYNNDKPILLLCSSWRDENPLAQLRNCVLHTCAPQLPHIAGRNGSSARPVPNQGGLALCGSSFSPLAWVDSQAQGCFQRRSHGRLSLTKYHLDFCENFSRIWGKRRLFNF